MRSFSERRFIVGMIPAILLMGFGLDLYLPAQKAMINTFHLTVLSAQWALTIYMYGFGLGQLGAGPWVDRFGRKSTFVASLLLYSIGSLWCAVAAHYPLFLVGRGIEALGAGGIMVCVYVIARDHYEGPAAVRVFTSLRGVGILSPLAAPLLSAYLTVTFGWRAIFCFLVLLGMLALLSSKRIPFPLFVRSAPKSYRMLLKGSPFQYYALITSMVQTVMFSFFSLSPVIYMHLLGYKEWVFALLFSINASAFLVISLGGARWIAKRGVQKSIRTGASLLFASGLGMLFLHFWKGLSLLTLCLPSMMASGACALIVGPASSAALHPFKKHVGKAASLLGFLEFMIGGFLGTCVVYIPLNGVLPFAICLLFTSSVILWCATKVRSVSQGSACEINKA